MLYPAESEFCHPLPARVSRIFFQKIREVLADNIGKFWQTLISGDRAHLIEKLATSEKVIFTVERLPEGKMRVRFDSCDKRHPKHMTLSGFVSDVIGAENVHPAA